VAIKTSRVTAGERLKVLSNPQMEKLTERRTKKVFYIESGTHNDKNLWFWRQKSYSAGGKIF